MIVYDLIDPNKDLDKDRSSRKGLVKNGEMLLLGILGWPRFLLMDSTHNAPYYDVGYSIYSLSITAHQLLPNMQVV